MNKKTLIFQFRNGKLEKSERASFAEKFDVPQESIIFINILNENHTYPELDEVKAIVIAGSGDNSLTISHPWFESLTEYIRKAIDRHIPVLGVCFGHQFLALLYGAKIVQDPAQKEIGCVSVKINQLGLSDPLLKGMGENFYTIAGHNDSVINVPTELEVLASTERCPIQMFKINGSFAYGVQFHPELSKSDYEKRLAFYRDLYVDKEFNFDELLMEGDSPTTGDQVLKNFKKLVEQRI